MYGTCLHCNSRLGANELIASFPVGRRLAFDAAKGRLWVVCPKCHRWNLTPLEERWEAIEQCEREFRATRLRASTDNIGLARTREGTELVRIGRPERPEMAAWRYAREFRRRWVRYGLPLTGATAVFGVAQLVNVAELVSPVWTFGGLGVASAAMVLLLRRGSRVRIVDARGRATTLSRNDYGTTAIVPEGDGGWSLSYKGMAGTTLINGAPARHRLRAILTAANFSGGLKSRISTATAALEQAGTSEAFIRRLAQSAKRAGDSTIGSLAPEFRLALEMALHEETERLAMEGELGELTDAWELAEEVAAIADEMMLPPDVLARFARLTAEPRR